MRFHTLWTHCGRPHLSKAVVQTPPLFDKVRPHDNAEVHSLDTVQERKTRRGLLDSQTFSYCGRAYKGRFGLKIHPSRAAGRPRGAAGRPSA